MELNEQRKVKLPVDKILRTLDLSGNTGTGMSSMPTQMITGLLKEWAASPTPQQETTYVDPASRANESLHAQETDCSSIEDLNLMQALRVGFDDLLISAQEKTSMIEVMEDHFRKRPVLTHELVKPNSRKM